MIAWLIIKHKVVLATTIGVTLIGEVLFFRLAHISSDLHILVPFFTFAAVLFYLLCFSWPFMGAAIIELNKRLVGASWPKAESLATFLLWFALLNVVLEIIGTVLGDAASALGVSAGSGLLAGCCRFLSRQRSV